jgi:hypothetical protein
MSHINNLLNYYIENDHLNLTNNINEDDLLLLIDNIKKFNIIINMLLSKITKGYKCVMCNSKSILITFGCKICFANYYC